MKTKIQRVAGSIILLAASLSNALPVNEYNVDSQAQIVQTKKNSVDKIQQESAKSLRQKTFDDEIERDFFSISEDRQDNKTEDNQNNKSSKLAKSKEGDKSTKAKQAVKEAKKTAKDEDKKNEGAKNTNGGQDQEQAKKQIKAKDKQEDNEANKKKVARSTAKIFDINPSYVYKKSANSTHMSTFLYRDQYAEAVFDAIKTGDMSALNTLIDILKTTEIRNANGETPLIAASKSGKESIVRFLLVNGANIYAKDKKGKNAYQTAKSQAIKEIIKVMID